MINIQVEVKNKFYCLYWDDSVKSLLKRVAITQQGFERWKQCLDLEIYFRDMDLCFESVPDEIFSKNLEKIWQFEINRVLKFINYDSKLERSKKYLEIGSGISILGLLLSQAFPDIDFYFVDNNYVENLKNVPFYNDQHHAFYNSFEVINNCIKNSKLDNNRIHLLIPNSSWPDRIDIIISTMSYCWHYSPHVYLQKIISNLNNNGYLMLDVLHTSNNLDILTNQFNQPVAQFLYENKKLMVENAKYGIFDRSMLNFNSSEPHGGRYMWIKNI